ncbi:MAG: DUF4065 domain-containing protein [Clostridia bacterium]|nr:DUF4065 domain-containing protein [Clostridia bacterium]
MTYNVLDVARYIITYCNRNSRPISNLKLQKMLYYAWVDYFKETNIPLYTEAICAWQFGPVVPEVYYEFCSFAGLPIEREYDVQLDVSDIPIVNAILNRYINTSVSELVNRTHEKNSPWYITYRQGEGRREPIPFALIQEVEWRTHET